MKPNDSIPPLDALGPVIPPTPQQRATVLSLLAGEPDEAELVEMILGGAR